MGTAHPVIRLPVFFMGISAGVLCVRIQEGDLDAFLSKIKKNKYPAANVRPKFGIGIVNQNQGPI